VCARVWLAVGKEWLALLEPRRVPVVLDVLVSVLERCRVPVVLDFPVVLDLPLSAALLQGLALAVAASL